MTLNALVWPCCRRFPGCLLGGIGCVTAPGPFDISSLHARAATPIEALLAQGAALPESKTSKTCKKLLKHAESLWTFVYIEGVEPTNNRAEQAVRHGVILRKSAAERTLKLAVSSSSAFSPCMPHYANNSAPFSNSH